MQLSWSDSFIKDCLASAEVGRDHPEYGLMYNLAHASIDQRMGIRSGLLESMKMYIADRFEWLLVCDPDPHMIWMPRIGAIDFVGLHNRNMAEVVEWRRKISIR